jgi:DNA-binding CsgD family transcriptional regulator
MGGVEAVSYGSLPQDIRTTAERILTQKQLDVFKLWCGGAGTARIATMLDVSEPVARRHLSRARQKIRIATDREAA